MFYVSKSPYFIELRWRCLTTISIFTEKLKLHHSQHINFALRLVLPQFRPVETIRHFDHDQALAQNSVIKGKV